MKKSGCKSLRKLIREEKIRGKMVLRALLNNKSHAIKHAALVERYLNRISRSQALISLYEDILRENRKGFKKDQGLRENGQIG